MNSRLNLTTGWMDDRSARRRRAATRGGGLAGTYWAGGALPLSEVCASGMAFLWGRLVFGMNSCLDPQLVGWMTALHVGAVQLRGAGGWLAGRGIGWRQLGRWCPAATRGLRLVHGVFVGSSLFWDGFVFGSPAGWMDDRSARRRRAATRGERRR